MGIIPFQSTNLHRMHKRKERKFRQTGTGKSNLRPKDTRHAAHKEKSNDAILHLNTSCVTVSNSSSMHYQHGQKNENLLYFNLCNMHTVTSCITFFGWHTFWRMESCGSCIFLRKNICLSVDRAPPLLDATVTVFSLQSFGLCRPFCLKVTGLKVEQGDIVYCRLTNNMCDGQCVSTQLNIIGVIYVGRRYGQKLPRHQRLKCLPKWFL